MRSSYWFVVGVLPPTASIAPRWTGGCEVRNLDCKTDECVALASRTYGQYCAIARGAEIFAERWTPLIVRSLCLGCGSFSEILEGARTLPYRALGSAQGYLNARESAMVFAISLLLTAISDSPDVCQATWLHRCR
jgi:hypothetical protein